MTPEMGTSPEIPDNPNRAEAQRALDNGELPNPGAESEDSEAADTAPGLPAEHDSEVGSTDQHSDV
jgi:hypothetical protein